MPTNTFDFDFDSKLIKFIEFCIDEKVKSIEAKLERLLDIKSQDELELKLISKKILAMKEQVKTFY